MVWLDGLDIHIVKLFEASFREGAAAGPGEATTPAQPEGYSAARYGANLLPVEDDRGGPSSPVFSYPYARTRAALEAMRQRAPWSRWHGLKMKYANPVTGDYAMPTIATFIQLLPKSFKTAPYRSTSSTVFVCVEGRGRTRIGEESFAWGPHDIFVAPSWVRHSHEAEEDAVLFSFSDQGVQEKLGFFREEKAEG